MTSVLSCLVATIALAADPGLQGLPLGIPPAPDDAVISHVAPPQCLFYVNWAGTASPSASSTSETEKLLAEPEVQDFLHAINKVVVAYLKKADEEGKEAAAVTLSSRPQATAATAPPEPLPAVDDPYTKAYGKAVAENSGSLSNTALSAPAIAPDAASAQVPAPTGTPLAAGPSIAPVAEKPKFNISAEDYGDWLNALVTHPTAIFVADVKITPPKPAGKAAEASGSPDAEIQAGMVVSLGADAARLQSKLVRYLKQAKKAGGDGFRQIKIAGETWYRSNPTKPGDKNRVTFGFHGEYLVVGVGRGTVEGMLARWSSPTPAWLSKALEQTQVPRRTGIVYLNLKAIRDKLLPLADSKKDAVAALELLGLYNVDSLVSTTGLEDYGMINRVLLALDGKPRGLLDMVADRPLTAKDLEPIPHDALLAVAARVDLDRTFKILLSTYEKAGVGGAEVQKGLDELKKECGIDIHRFLASVGDAWCVYNSPAEGEMAFLGWTAVVPVRDRATLVEGWEKLCAKNASPDGKKGGGQAAADAQPEFRKCRFAGHQIYYLAGQAIAPAFYISDREMVMTLNMPALKAYLTRKDHRSLATLPGVALALNDQNRPVALGYCNMPELFDSLYPWCSLLATAIAGGAQQAKIDLEPTFWPSAPAIRSHLRPEITCVERTPHGLQLTCRYSLPTGGANGPLWLIGLSALGSQCSHVAVSAPPLPSPFWLQSLPEYAPDRPPEVALPSPTTPGSGTAPNSGVTSPGASTAPPGYGSSSCPLSVPAAPTVATSASPYAPSSVTASSYGSSSSPATAAPGVMPTPVRSELSNQEAAQRIGDHLSKSSQLAFGERISVRYLNGTVWLQGHVHNQEQLDKAVAVVLATDGVVIKQVIRDELTVKGAAKPGSSADSRATKNVDSAATTAPSYSGHVALHERLAATQTGVAVAVAPARPSNSTSNPYSSAPAYPMSSYGSTTAQSPYSSPAGAYSSYAYSVAAPPSPSCAVTVPDVIAMTRAGVDDGLIVNQIRAHGLAAPLQASNVIYLHQQGVSRDVIAFMQKQPVPTAAPRPVPGSSSTSTAPAAGSSSAAAPYRAAPTLANPSGRPPSPPTPPKRSDHPKATEHSSASAPAGPGVVSYQSAAQPRADTSQVYFVGPEGLTVQWDVTAPGRFDSEQLVAPARYNFPQGALYRLKLANIPGRPGVELFPTIEVGPAMPRTEAFLAHNAIPIEFTDEDFDQVMTGNFVTKVIYLPDPEFQEMALAGVGTLVSTKLDPGQDPIVEADRKGAIMAIVRLGNKDLAIASATPEQMPGGPGAMYQSPMQGPCPPGFVAGVTSPQYGMPISGTPIGLAGPPHVPLGVPAGLQRDTIVNHTHVPPATASSTQKSPESRLEQVSTATFEEQVLKCEKTVLVDFCAEWCIPCKQLGPVLEDFAQAHPEVRMVKVNIDENSDLVARYEVKSIPSLLVIRGGQVTSRSTGVITKEKLAEMTELGAR